jgi:Domain of unknown function (DUF4288)
MSYDANRSPVGWYVASYLLRFVELGDECNSDPEHRFTAWENTIIVKAQSIEEAYDKTVAVASAETAPYLGGDDGVAVQWVFEGVTTVVPIYEKLTDGAEIMWEKHGATKLKNLRKRVIRRDDVRQY